MSDSKEVDSSMVVNLENKIRLSLILSWIEPLKDDCKTITQAIRKNDFYIVSWSFTTSDVHF